MKPDSKGLTLRFPDEIIEWLRRKAASETISRNARVSINSFVLELIKREMDQDKEG